MMIRLWIPTDSVLGAIAPLGLAAAAGTALVVDAGPDGPNYPGSGSLAELVTAGPRKADLIPTRPGLAVLRNGGISIEEAAEVVDALSAGWPHLVIRHSGYEAPASPWVAVVADLPGALRLQVHGPVVVQRTGWKSSMKGDVTLPLPSTRLIRTLLEGRLPGPSRWVHAWKPVWNLA